MATEVIDGLAPEPEAEFTTLEAGLDALESAGESRKPWWRRVFLAKITIGVKHMKSACQGIGFDWI